MRRIFRVTGCLVALCLVFLSPTAARQQEPAAPVFRGGVAFVNVDVYPRRNGRLVEGLSAKDFQVFEDGKPQRVEAFEFIRVAPNAPDDERRDPNTKEEGDRLAADPHNRVFVLFLDLYHISFSAATGARQPLLDFVNRLIGPSDLFGVMTPEIPARSLVLGRQTDTLTRDLANPVEWSVGEPHVTVNPRTPAEKQLYYSCDQGEELVRVHREDMLMTALEDLMVHLGVLRDERKSLILVSEGWNPRTTLQASATGAIPRIGVTPAGRLGDTPQVGSANSGWCDRQITRLAGIDFEHRFKELLTSARRANVSFYPIDVGGLKTFAPTASWGSSPDQRRVPNVNAMRQTGELQINVLRTLAENTDGRAIVNTNDMRGGFRQIADDLSAYYLLGYSSTNTALDGKYREITVKVTAPKVSVTARKGYLAPVPAATVDGRSAAAAVVPDDVSDALGNLARSRPDAGPRPGPTAVTRGSSLGDPICLVGGPSARLPLRPAEQFEFHRNERLRIEWPQLQTIDQRIARVLDRRGQPLPFPAAVTDVVDDRGVAHLAVDLNFAPFAEGEYVLELTVNAGRSTSTKSLVAFRVVR